MNERFRCLGGGVFLDSMGGGPEQAVINGCVRHRFMDTLYLPSPTHLLAPSAILAINRWRDQLMVDAPLLHRDRVRRIAVAVGRTIFAPRVIEIGCGVYPISIETNAAAYAGLDIDPIAMDAAAAVGIKVAASPAEILLDAASADIIFALFSMQFAIGGAILDLLGVMPAHAIAFFNLPTRDLSLLATRVAQIESRGLQVATFELADAGPRDRLVLASRSATTSAASVALQAAYNQACTEWPALKSSAGWVESKRAIAHR